MRTSVTGASGVVAAGPAFAGDPRDAADPDHFEIASVGVA